MIDDLIDILGHRPAVALVARLGAAGLGSFALFLAVRRRRLRGRARRLFRTLNLQHQLDQLFLRQTLQITAFHIDMDSAFALSGKGWVITAMPCYEHLSPVERDEIAVLRAAGHSQATIARALGRSPSTVCRELSRNALPSGRYSPQRADGAYLERRRREAVLEQDERLRQFVVQRLSEGWSPEQIAGWLQAGNEPKLRSLVISGL